MFRIERASPKSSTKVDHRATHIQTVWMMSISLDKVDVSSTNNMIAISLVIPERQNLCGEKSQSAERIKTK